MKRRTKDQWLYAYDAAVRRRAREMPDWQHWPAGHMYFSEGISPDTAARRFLSQTKWGRKRKKTSHRRFR